MRGLATPRGPLALIAETAVINEALDRRFALQSLDDAPSCTLALDSASMPDAGWDDAFDGAVHGDLLEVSLTGARGSFDLAQGRGRLAVATDFRRFDLHIQNALRMILVEDALRGGWHLCHSAALVRDGRAALFLGASGTGKSTIAASGEKHGWQVVNDDLVFLSDSSATIFGATFHGNEHLATFDPGPHSLAAVFVLRQAPVNEVCELTASRGTLELATSFVSWRERSAIEHGELIDAANACASAVPVHELRCTAGPEVWEVINDELR